MDLVAPQTDLSQWFPTYGFLTSQRILERFNITLSADELVHALKNKDSLYHQLLTVPLKNVLNGIVLQQAQDYQVYAQKLFIDYLLSGEDQKDESSPGANTRQELEAIRQQLIALGETFRTQELSHQSLISKSQLALITVVKSLEDKLRPLEINIGSIVGSNKQDSLKKASRVPFVYSDKQTPDVLGQSSSIWAKIEGILDIKLDEAQRRSIASIFEEMGDPWVHIGAELQEYATESEAISIELRNYRLQFYNLILRTTELIQLLPDYHVDKIKDEENRASLYFDAHIGGD